MGTVVRGRAQHRLDLNGTPGGDDRRRDQRRDMAGGRRHEAGRDRAAGTEPGGGRDAACRGCATGRGTATATAAGRRPTAGDAELGEDAERRDDGSDRMELTADAADRMPEVPAAFAIVEVPAGGRRRADAAVVAVGDLVTDLCAGRLPRLERGGERNACADEDRFDGRHRHAQRVGELGVAHPRQLAHQQRGALLVGQAANVLDQARERLALLGGRDRVGDRAGGGTLDRRRRDRHRPADLIDAAVVGDAIQPCAEGEIAVARPQPVVRLEEHVLERVLGVLPRRRQHLAGVGEQPGPVAVVDDPEGLVVPGTEERYELIVRAESKPRRAERTPLPGECRRCLESGRFHVTPRTLTRGVGESSGVSTDYDSETITCLTTE